MLNLVVMSENGSMEDTDSRRRRNDLKVPSTLPVAQALKARLSTSEPQAAPAGHKIVVAAMEIGLVRDVVEHAIVFHDNLIETPNIIGRTYSLCFNSVTKTYELVDSVVRTTDRVYEDTFPGFIVSRTNRVQESFWSKWVWLDETMSSKVSDQLAKHPFFRKSTREIAYDVEKSVEEMKLWKLAKAASAKIGEIINKFRPKPNPDDGCSGECDCDEIDQVSTPASKSSSHTARGQTSGGRQTRVETSATKSPTSTPS